MLDAPETGASCFWSSISRIRRNEKQAEKKDTKYTTDTKINIKVVLASEPTARRAFQS